MNIQSAINKEVFIPRDERMLVAVEVWRRKRKRLSILLSGAKAEYATFICVSVTNTRPHQLLITKVKRFGGSSSFTRRSKWTVEQLRQVNGINPNKDTPEFDLGFDNSVDQWVANSSAEKCIFIHILYHACQTYWTEFINCQSKLTRGSATPVGNVVQRVNVALGERGDRLTRAEDKTVELMQKAQQFADTAHKLALNYSK
ncbi:syntaxin-binding protein 6 [Pleuronectes platessa]|uniref:syntaxin-binding protein 6 n=1 Tax=Pleuronectes platessa TaxID=8262 RepID=UPI00232A397A|nr:syntaxin-binding protein 6 [Pleuronectes platessa]